MKKLKNLNWKQLAIDHGEKVVLAVVALLSVMFVAGAEWAPEKRTPEELSRNVDEGSRKVEASTWPEAEQAIYTEDDKLGARIREMKAPIEGTYAYSTDIIWPLIKRHEPIKEPELLAVEDLQATPGKVILMQMPKSAGFDLADAEGAEGAGRGNEGAPDSLLPKKDRRGSGPGAGLMPIDGPRGRPVGADPKGAAVLPGANPGAYPGSFGTDSLALENVQGRRFIAVRGIVPFARQADRFSKARNNESPLLSRQLLEYLDFQLERQRAVSGPDPWAGPWQPVDIKVALDVLEAAASFEVDSIDPAVTDPVFTMPLPERVAGEWDAWSGHERVRDFELTEEGKELLNKVTEQIKKFDEEKKLLEQQLGPEKKGFASQKIDVGGAVRRIGQDKNLTTQFQQFAAGPMAGPADTKDMMNKFNKISAGGTLLLFRYFDFDVEPGNAYRYRVRLVLRNPNYGLSPDQVVAPFVAENETRETPWSKESTPAVVGEDVRYFLSRVEPVRGHNIPSAIFDIFQWNEKTGTPANDEKSKAVLGQRIGTTAKTTIIAPPVKVDKEGEFAFNTGDYLLDISDSSLIDDAKFVSFHTDLKLSPDPRVKPSLIDKVLVANDYGELVTLDTQSLKKTEKQMQAEHEALIRVWDEELGDSSQGMSAADVLADNALGPNADDGKKKKGGRQKDLSRKDPRGAGAGAGAAAMPMPGRAGMDPTEPGRGKGKGKK